MVNISLFYFWNYLKLQISLVDKVRIIVYRENGMTIRQMANKFLRLNKNPVSFRNSTMGRTKAFAYSTLFL